MTTTEYLDELLGLSAQIHAIHDHMVPTDQLERGDRVVNVNGREHEFWEVIKTEPTADHWMRITARCGPRIHRLECSPMHTWPTVKAQR